MVATPVRSGIPTTYSATNFRSRLEARWAAFFDLIGWQWVYEPLDASGYIPDFLIQGPYPFFVEVGPCITWADYESKAKKPDAVAAELGHDLMVVGVSPFPAWTPEGSGSHASGWLGEFYPGHDPNSCDCDPEWRLEPAHAQSGVPAGYGWGTGVWAVGDTKRLGVYHCFNSYAHRPHLDGHESPLHGMQGFDALDEAWSKAGNRVQWKAA